MRSCLPPLAFAFATALAVACVGVTGPSVEAPAKHRAAVRRIEQAIGDARCTDDSQCRVAAIGEMPCGGGESYLAWSTLVTDPDRLEPMLRAYAAERRSWHDRIGLLSPCRIHPPPGSRCMSKSGSHGRCLLEPAGSGSGSGIR